MWQSNCCSQDLRREFRQAVSIFAARDKVIKIRQSGGSVTPSAHRFSVSATIWKTEPVHL